MEQARNENRFDQGSLIGHYFHLALPVVLSSIVTIVYNLADTYFIAQTDTPATSSALPVCAIK